MKKIILKLLITLFGILGLSTCIIACYGVPTPQEGFDNEYIEPIEENVVEISEIDQ